MADEIQGINAHQKCRRSPGRPKGTKRYVVQFLNEILLQRGVDWRAEIARLMSDPEPDSRKLSAWQALMPYLVPRLATRDVEAPKPTPADSVKNAEQAKRLLDELEGKGLTER